MSNLINKVLVMAIFVVAFSCFTPTVSGADFNATESASMRITFDIPDAPSVEEPVIDEVDSADTTVEVPTEETPSTDDTPLVVPDTAPVDLPVMDPPVDTPSTTDLPVTASDLDLTPLEEIPVVVDSAPVVTEVIKSQDIPVLADLTGVPHEEVFQ